MRWVRISDFPPQKKKCSTSCICSCDLFLCQSLTVLLCTCLSIRLHPSFVSPAHGDPKRTWHASGAHLILTGSYNHTSPKSLVPLSFSCQVLCPVPLQADNYIVLYVIVVMRPGAGFPSKQFTLCILQQQMNPTEGSGVTAVCEINAEGQSKDNPSSKEETRERGKESGKEDCKEEGKGEKERDKGWDEKVREAEERR